jgi:hypothetical protein
MILYFCTTMEQTKKTTEISCGFLKNNICLLASDIAQKDCRVKYSTCYSCINCDRPRRLNIYTASLIVEHNSKINMQELSEAMLKDADGFGTTLANALAPFFQELPACQCPGHKDILNIWTKDYISKNLEYVVKWLQTEAYRRSIPFSPMLTRIFLRGLLLIQ